MHIMHFLWGIIRFWHAWVMDTIGSKHQHCEWADLSAVCLYTNRVMEHPSYVDDPPIFQMLLLFWIMGGDTLLLLCKQSCVKATGPEAQICSLPMPSVSTMVHGPYSSTILQRVLLLVVTGAKSTRNLQASPNGKVDPDDFEKNLHKIRLGDRFGNLQSSQDGNCHHKRFLFDSFWGLSVNEGAASCMYIWTCMCFVRFQTLQAQTDQRKTGRLTASKPWKIPFYIYIYFIPFTLVG